MLSYRFMYSPFSDEYWFRKQVLLANKELLLGLSPQGAEGRVQIKKSVNELSLNDAGKKSIGEAQKNLAAQSKAVDDQIAIIGKEGTGAAEIAAAAQKALDQVRISSKLRIALV